MSHEFTTGVEPVAGTGYRLIEILGRGGFGEVWKASSPGGAEVAIKVIRLGGREGRKEFKALQLVKKVRHPNLVPTIAFWLLDENGAAIDEDLLEQDDWLRGTKGDGTPLQDTMVAEPKGDLPRPKQLVVAMGLGDMSLNDRLDECRDQGRPGIPTGELLSYMEDAARAIDYLNSPIHTITTGPAAIQHCDIKPHNIMIVGGSAQVCDFGLAQMLGADRTTTAAASLAYAAPECLRDGAPSATTDQYSLAVTYYELKTGLLPYREQTQMGVMNAKINQELDFGEVSAAERDVLMRATAPEPAARYHSTSEFVEDLRAAVRGDTTTTTLRPRKRSSPSPIPLAATLMLVLVSAVAIWYVFFSGNGDTPFRSDPEHGDRRSETRTDGEDQPSDTVDDSSPNRVERLLTDARRQYRAGDFQQAIESYTQVLEMADDNEEAHFNRGKCQLELKNFEAAIADFEEAARLDADRYGTHPDYAQAYLERGTSALESRQTTSAAEAFSKAIEHDPTNARAFSGRGVTRYLSDQWDKAVDDFTSAIELGSSAEDYVRRGRTYQVLGKPTEAMADYNEAVAIDPTSIEAHYYRGDCYLDRNDRDAAVQAFTDAIEAGASRKDPPPELSSAYALRAACRMDDGDFAGAVADLTDAIHLGSADLRSLHESRATCFEKLDRLTAASHDRSILDCLARLEVDSGDAEALNELAYWQAASSEPEIRDGRRALEYATKACERTDWKNPHYVDTLAACYAELGDFPIAIEWSKKAIALAEDEEMAENFRSNLALFELGKPYRDSGE